MSRKWWNVALCHRRVVRHVADDGRLRRSACARPNRPRPKRPRPPRPAKPAVDPNWANQPMKDKCTVVLSVESGAQEKTFQSSRPTC